MSRTRYTIIVICLVGAFAAVAVWVIPFVRGIWPAVGPAGPVPSETPRGDDVQQTAGPLTAADGWTAAVFTDRVPGARDLAVDFQGNLWVSQPSQGTVSLITLDENGKPINISAVIRGLNKPHGLAFDPENPTHLYIAGETDIQRILTYSDAPPEHVADLPRGGRHSTRTLAFGSDGRLYVSIGSTCDVCRERNVEHGTVISMNRDGSDRRVDATGLRNAVFIMAHDDAVWTTEMGRDNLGDNLPPDEINVIGLGEEGTRDYGWPICYGERVHDTDFDRNQYVRDPCEDTVPPVISLPAHVAPLGLAFLDDDDILVAYHGSWNSTVPVGYKVVRWRRNGERWSSTDFLTGFLQDGSAFGRPVDVLIADKQTIYVSDDKAGAIWKVSAER